MRSTSGTGRHVTNQRGKVGNGAIVRRPPEGVHVLTQQVDLAHALFRQAHDFGNDIIQRTTDFFATRVGDDAETAVLAAALHDRHKGCRAFGTRWWEAVEFLDLREADIDNAAPVIADPIDHHRQAVQGLGAEDDVDTGRTPGQ